MRLCTLPPDCGSSKCDPKRTIRQGFRTTADEQSTPADRYCINRIYSILCCLDDTLGSCFRKSLDGQDALTIAGPVVCGTG